MQFDNCLHPGQEIAEVACDDSTRPAYVTTTNSTIIETINYPMDYPDYTECEWIIQPENAAEVVIFCTFKTVW